MKIFQHASHNPTERFRTVLFLTDFIFLIRSEVQVWREEMRALRREDIGNFKSVLDNSTSEATGELKKTTQVILNSVKTNVKNNISEEVRFFELKTF